MIHNLKISSQYYDAVERGYKPFEIRKNDRDFRVGDVLIMKETAEKPREPIEAEIQYILRYEDFPDGLKEGYCILGLRNVHKIWFPITEVGKA